MSLEKAEPNATTDLTGKTCPYTVMGARDALKPLQKGEILEVITDYEPAAQESIPNFLRKKNYPFTVAENDSGKWRFLIEKTD